MKESRVVENWKELFIAEDIERYIKDDINDVYWDNLSRYQELSEDFIREFKDYVNWHNIFIYQILSDDFMCEFSDKLETDFFPVVDGTIDLKGYSGDLENSELQEFINLWSQQLDNIR